MSADNYRSWLRHAEQDMRAIRNCMFGPDPSPESAAYHCQQAAEKLVKAVLVRHGIVPPKIHSIRPLLDLLPSGDPLKSSLAGAVKFSAFAYAYRYPSFSSHEPTFDPPSMEELTGWHEELAALEALVADTLNKR